MKMNEIARMKMVTAMEYIVRNVNNEELLDPWLSVGVADGDIPYGSLTIELEDPDTLEYYIEDAEFADLMDTVLDIMSRAYKDGGLYCDGIVSKEATA